MSPTFIALHYTSRKVVHINLAHIAEVAETTVKAAGADPQGRWENGQALPALRITLVTGALHMAIAEDRDLLLALLAAHELYPLA